MANRQYSPAGFALTKRCEGCRLTAYQDVAGIWTIGYGHTGRDVYPGRVITQAEAEALLLQDLAHAIAAVNQMVTADITQHQFDALVDFAFNLGVHALEGSTLLREVNQGNFAAALSEFSKWDHAGGKVVAGLLKRRQDEVALAMSAGGRTSAARCDWSTRSSTSGRQRDHSTL